MKNLKTFEQFINEDSTEMINNVDDREENRQDVNAERNKPQQQKDQEFQNKVKKQQNLKVGEIEKSAEDIGQRQQIADKRVEDIKKNTNALRPSDPIAAKAFDDEQKKELSVVAQELDNAAKQREFLQKQADNLRRKF